MESKGSSLINQKNMVVVGNIGAPHGLKGWVRIHSYTEPPENLFEYPICYLKKDTRTDKWEQIHFSAYQPHGKFFIGVIDGYTDINEAELITNCELGVPRQELPDLEPGQYYWTDFVGMTVMNQTGDTLGVIEGLFETGANDVMIVKGIDRQRLIPYVLDDVIKNVDLKTRIMLVDWDSEF
jgi:16S rRNA processing protein RimM